jgi:prophage DNA circulation protein
MGINLGPFLNFPLNIKIRKCNIVELEIFQTMEPDWNEVKGILKRYEDIFECIRNQFGEFMGRFSNMENLVSVLFNRTESLGQERHKTFSLEQTMAILLQRMERMEQEIKQSHEREIERHRVNELERLLQHCSKGWISLNRNTTTSEHRQSLKSLIQDPTTTTQGTLRQVTRS